uniref:Uncharacterized protein n=1 Tax=Romanomermis culicivorax TaxID=13658 RepID=A0A915I4F0_ROMCU
MDIKQNQRCGHITPDIGEGMSVSTTDKNSLFDTNVLQKRFNIHPGYEYIAKIKTIRTVRSTENLGRCRSEGYHSTNSSLPVMEYTKTYCQAVLWLRSLFKKCECVPPVPSWFTNYLNRETVGSNIDYQNLCSKTLSSMSCLLESVVSEATATFISKDSTCLDACIQVNPVSSVMTKRKLTTAYVKNFNVSLSDILGDTDYTTLKNWMDRNAIVLHVDFETNKIDIMTEDQVFTFIDLLRYVASACGFLPLPMVANPDGTNDVLSSDPTTILGSREES